MYPFHSSTPSVPLPWCLSITQTSFPTREHMYDTNYSSSKSNTVHDSARNLFHVHPHFHLLCAFTLTKVLLTNCCLLVLHICPSVCGGNIQLSFLGKHWRWLWLMLFHQLPCFIYLNSPTYYLSLSQGDWYGTNTLSLQSGVASVATVDSEWQRRRTGLREKMNARVIKLM